MEICEDQVGQMRTGRRMGKDGEALIVSDVLNGPFKLCPRRRIRLALFCENINFDHCFSFSKDYMVGLGFRDI